MHSDPRDFEAAELYKHFKQCFDVCKLEAFVIRRLGNATKTFRIRRKFSTDCVLFMGPTEKKKQTVIREPAEYMSKLMLTVPMLTRCRMHVLAWPRCQPSRSLGLLHQRLLVVMAPHRAPHRPDP